MDGNHQDKTESKPIGSEAELWLPSSVSKNEQKKRTTFFTRKGLANKTLWDWLQLLLVGYLSVMVTLFTSYQSSLIAQITNKQQVEQQVEQQQETILQTYMDQISGLLVDKNLNLSNTNNNAQKVARARTLITLSELNSTRKGFLLRFLYELGLITVNNAKIDLSNADFSGADLQGFDLANADLHGTILSVANLGGVNLSGADLSGAQVTNEQLAKAKTLKGATMPDGSTHP